MSSLQRKLRLSHAVENSFNQFVLNFMRLGTCIDNLSLPFNLFILLLFLVISFFLFIINLLFVILFLIFLSGYFCLLHQGERKREARTGSFWARK